MTIERVQSAREQRAYSTALVRAVLMPLFSPLPFYTPAAADATPLFRAATL